MSPILGIYSSTQQAANLPNSFESIATQTVGAGGAASITFSSIPSTYKHLQLRYIARDTTSTYDNNLAGYFNSDNTYTNYRWHYLLGDGASATAGAVQVSALPLSFGVETGANNSSSIFGTGIVDILDYTNTNKNKVIRGLSGLNNNNAGDQDIRFYSGLWVNTSAITSITLYPQPTGSFTQYSTFALYGIKGA